MTPTPQATPSATRGRFTGPRFRSLAACLLSGAMALTGPALAGQSDGDENVTKSHGYSSFGALKYGADFEHLDYVNPDAPKGGEISSWSQGNFDSFNQYARAGVPAALNTIGTERIMVSTLDDPYGLYCLLCTSLEYPEDLSWVIFNLREDVTFADGSLMTAEDVEFTHKLFLEQGIIEYRRIVESFFTGVEILGPHRIKFSFAPDSSVRDRIGIAAGPVFSKAWFEEKGARLDESTQTPFMATGAYVLDSYDINRRVIYRRNPDYWGYDHPLSVGQNNFDRIRIEYFADTTAAFEGFKSGVYTFRIEDKAQNWAEGYNFPNVTNGHVEREEVPDGSVGYHLSWVFNLSKPKWQDKRVRQAIAMVFNFEWTNRTIFYDLYKQPASFWPGTDLAAVGTPTDGEVAILQPLVDEGLIDAAILTEEAVSPISHDAERNQPNRRVLRQAAALLDEAGWEVGDDGIRRKDGQELELVNIQTFPTYFRIVEPYLRNLEALGVKARMDRMDTAQYVERRRSGDFDLTNQGFQMGFEPSLGLAQWFGSAAADNSSRNLMRLKDPAVDRLIGTVLEAKDLDALKDAVHALDRTLRFMRFDIPLWYNDKTFVAYYNQYKHPEELPPLGLGQYSFWWHDADAEAELKQAGVLR